MPSLQITPAVQYEMVEHCFEAYPLEGCGLLAAAGDVVSKCYPVANVAASARVYELHSEEYLAADKDASENGLEIVGVFHSHTHTEAYPSPTDVAKAPVPDWHYVLVSFAVEQPEVRSFRIIDAEITEEPIVVVNT